MLILIYEGHIENKLFCLICYLSEIKIIITITIIIIIIVVVVVVFVAVVVVVVVVVVVILCVLLKIRLFNKNDFLSFNQFCSVLPNVLYTNIIYLKQFFQNPVNKEPVLLNLCI